MFKNVFENVFINSKRTPNKKFLTLKAYLNFFGYEVLSETPGVQSIWVV